MNKREIKQLLNNEQVYLNFGVVLNKSHFEDYYFDEDEEEKFKDEDVLVYPLAEAIDNYVRDELDYNYTLLELKEFIEINEMEDRELEEENERLGLQDE